MKFIVDCPNNSSDEITIPNLSDIVERLYIVSKKHNEIDIKNISQLAHLKSISFIQCRPKVALPNCVTHTYLRNASQAEKYLIPSQRNRLIMTSLDDEPSSHINFKIFNELNLCLFADVHQMENIGEIMRRLINVKGLILVYQSNAKLKWLEDEVFKKLKFIKVSTDYPNIPKSRNINRFIRNHSKLSMLLVDNVSIEYKTFMRLPKTQVNFSNDNIVSTQNRERYLAAQEELNYIRCKRMKPVFN